MTGRIEWSISWSDDAVLFPSEVVCGSCLLPDCPPFWLSGNSGRGSEAYLGIADALEDAL